MTRPVSLSARTSGRIENYEQDEWKRESGALVCLTACAGLFVYSVTGVAQTPKPKRINRAIELLEQGQPIYYTGSHSGTTGTFEQGKKDAQTWADYISYDMEVAPYDVAGLSAYMQGLAAGGPTRTGHKTPAVIVNVAARGTDEATVRANAWSSKRYRRYSVSTGSSCAARPRPVQSRLL